MGSDPTWELDPAGYGAALAAQEARELAEGARLRGEAPAKPWPAYYAVNDRPVKLVPTADGGLDVLALDLRTGAFARDLGYLSRCLGGSADVDQLDEEEFARRVEKIRRGLPPAGR